MASPVPAAISPTPIPSPSAAGFDACSLLTSADLSKILGGEAQAKAMPTSGWIAGQCAWNGPASGFFVSVGTAESLKESGDPSVPDAEAMLAQFTQQASGAGAPKDVPGVGDGAVLAAIGIGAYKGDAYIQITNLGLTEDQIVKIAKLAVAKL